MTTTSATASDTCLNVADFITQMERLMRNFRRTAITFAVDLAHPGPMLRRETPCDGTIIECSWVQANEVHKRWPLKLIKVISRDVADFVPVTPMFGEEFAANLPSPPYELPEERAHGLHSP